MCTSASAADAVTSPANSRETCIAARQLMDAPRKVGSRGESAITLWFSRAESPRPDIADRGRTDNERSYGSMVTSR